MTKQHVVSADLALRMFALVAQLVVLNVSGAVIQWGMR